VLMAMEQGETLKMALDGAVPEDVRGKLAAAVSAIAQTKGMKVNADGIMDASQINSSDLKVNIQETVGEPSPPAPPASGSNDVQTSESKKQGDGSSDDTDDKKQSMKLDKDQEKGESKDQKVEEKHIDSLADQNEAGTGSTSDKHDNSEETVETDNSGGAQVKPDQDTATADSSKKEDNDVQHSDGKSKDDSTDQKDTTPKTEESLPFAASSPEAPPTDKEADNSPKKGDDKSESSADQNQQTSSKSEEPPPPNPPPPNPPALGVSQAFEAFTGFDDSTQMAVNSVFGVLENMINQYDAQNEEDEQKNGDQQDKQSGEQPGSSTGEAVVPRQSENKSASGDTDTGEVSLDSDDDHEKSDCTKEDAEKGSRGKQLTQNTISIMKNSFSSQGSKAGDYVDKVKGKKMEVNMNMSKSSGKTRQLHKVPVYVTVNPYGDSLYKEYLREYLLSNVSSPKSLDLDSTTDLLLEYSSEEGKWKFLDEEEDDSASESDDDINEYKGSSSKGQDVRSSAQANDIDEIIETSYVVLDTEKEQRPLEDHNPSDDLVRKLGGRPPLSGDLMLLVKNIILDTLKVEVGRRLGVQEMEPSLASELEKVADVVSLGIGQSQGLVENKEPSSGKLGTIQGGYVLKTISFAVTETSYLRKVLPVGVIVGSCLAALRKYFNVAVQQDDPQSLEDSIGKTNKTREEIQGHESGSPSKQKPLVEKEKDENSDSEDEHSAMDNFISLASENVQNLSSNTVMVGAVTAALGASAFLVPQQIEQFENGESAEISSNSFSENETHKNENGDAVSDSSQNNLVSSLAEKAMSVAAPVVPTTSDGAVDQDRLVAMLAEWGQRGGMLRLVGKLALLWGGLRGAMSLTDRLISFLHISERPLPQRILGFVCMVLVLWTPVVIPLLPTLVQNWTTQRSGMAEYACIVGLYVAVIILIMLWGKRIRERDHEHPLRRYGLDLTSLPKLQDFTKGLIGGFMLILSIHSTNALLGCASLSWPSVLSSSSTQAIFLLKGYGGMLLLAGQGVVTATVVAIVEELFFRSWLPEEIAVDIGHHRAVLVSGLAFAIFQRSLQALPGLWLLSLALSGARQRNKGSLAVPIGIRAGILASCYILQKGGFLIYHRSYPIWLTGTDPMQPFSGAVGLAASLIMAILLYKKQSSGMPMVPNAVKE
ncbi:hypothetical protein MKX01_040506, partial [Papaver californicum]